MTVNAEVTVEVIRDDSAPEDFETFETITNGLTLPLTLPVTFPKAGIVRKAFDLQRFDPAREFQFQLTTDSGKMVLRSIAASAWINTAEIQT